VTDSSSEALAAGRVRGWRRRPRRAWSSARGERRAAFFLLAPDVLGLALIYAGPILFTVYMSLYAWNGVTPDKEFVGFDNYRYLFDDPTWWKSLRVSATYVLLYVPLVTGGALLLAMLVAQRLPEARFFRSIYFLPMAVPLVVGAVVWQFVFEPSYGFANWLLGLVGIPKQAWLGSTDQALIVVVIVSAWKQVGYFMIIFLAGILDIPREYDEAARVDGAGTWRRFRSITLPLLRPTILFVTVMSVITALQDFDQIFVMTKGGPDHATYVQVYYIYDQALRYLKMGPASAASVVLFVIIMLVTLLQLRLFKGGLRDE
jgi:multiple sugar transport system permease protein